MKVLVIGGVAAGTKAAAKCMREDRGAEVLIVTKGEDISDEELLRSWLWSLIDDERLPDPLDDWESFDVNDYFERLVFRFLDEEKDER